MAVVRLLVLGMVRLKGRTHGYAVHQELVAWHVETWTRVKPGSIYHALKQLTKEEKLNEVGREPSEEGPGRTLYELTEAGEAEFIQLLESALGSFDLEELGTGVAFMECLPRRRVIEILKDQHRRAMTTRNGLEAMAPKFAHVRDAPHTSDLLSLWSGSLAANASWTRSLIQRLESGAYRMSEG
ncbi:MAG: transcriptional regulator [Armatimonadetes bacterium 55-13]|nr:PadR family transcriptional regulator [Armatimonadota bacterium]OJU61392.1 MAG: transcriptional regulator [Armatimonadetes bacterium 55-13]